MEFVKVENEDVSYPETCKIKQNTEEQTFSILHYSKSGKGRTK